MFYERTTSNMPMYKRRRSTKKAFVKRSSKRSYAMVPRPRLNGELAHRHVVTCSSTTGTGGAQLFLSNGAGVLNFVSNGPLGVNTSPNLSLSWSLAEMFVGIGGVPAIQIPVPNVAELQQLYDTFQIEKVELTMSFGNTESISAGEAQTGLNWVCPLIGHAPDIDDAANTNITQLQQYSTYKMHQSTDPLKVRFVPCPAGATYDPTAPAGGPAQIGFTRVQRQDINVAYAATPHYGYKMCVDTMRAQANGAVTLFSIQARVHFLMKNTR